MTKPRDNSAEAMAAYLLPLLSPWRAKAARLVDARVEDARTHAEKALTQTLIGTPDGRPTWAKVRQSPSYLAAFNRLDELIDAVAGPTARSLQGIASDVRAAALEDGWEYWLPQVEDHFPAARASHADGPSRAQVRWARGLVMFGHDDRAELSGPVESAKRALTMTITAAAMQSAKESERTRLLKAWAESATIAVGRAVDGLLTNSQVTAFNAAGKLIVHPDFHGEPAL